MHDMTKAELVRENQSLRNENARLKFRLKQRVSLPRRVWRWFFGWPVSCGIESLNVEVR
jgi:hypothetical protein